MRLLLVCLVCSALIGCNLATDLDAYPYRGTIIIDPEDDGATPRDMPTDLAQDAPTDLPADMPVPDDMPPDMIEDMEPLIINVRFTEIMADTSIDGGNELGEYVEITNIGTATIDPKLLQIELVGGAQTISVDLSADDAAEQAILAGIKPLLPGQSFVFIRQDTPAYRITAGLAPGTFYEHGRWSTPNVGLSNTTRTLRLLYPDPQTNLPLQFDLVSWAGGDLVEPGSDTSLDPLPMAENIAWSLDPFWYDFGPPGDASDWCYETNRLSGSQLLRGSPGAPLAGPCIRDLSALP